MTLLSTRTDSILFSNGRSISRLPPSLLLVFNLPILFYTNAFESKHEIFHLFAWDKQLTVRRHSSAALGLKWKPLIFKCKSDNNPTISILVKGDSSPHFNADCTCLIWSNHFLNFRGNRFKRRNSERIFSIGYIFFLFVIENLLLDTRAQLVSVILNLLSTCGVYQKFKQKQ